MLSNVPPEVERVVARCLKSDPERRFQTMADLKVALEELRAEVDSGDLSRPASPTRRKAWVGAVVALALLAIGAGLVLRWKRPSPRRAPLTRLTHDSGWTDFPAISPDGNLLAYASDRADDKNIDLWVQQVPDGQPVRLTRGPGDDTKPSFSPDGSRIVFQSTRGGTTGIYIIPTLGGEERLLVKDGLGPRFSPAGDFIAYVVFEEGVSHIRLVPTGGGPPRTLSDPSLFWMPPVWSPDGKHLLAYGRKLPEQTGDWYVLSPEGGEPVKTGMGEVLPRRAVNLVPSPQAWLARGNRILFQADVGDSRNLWQVPISPETWHAVGPPERVTSGTTYDDAPSVTPDGRLVFASRIDVTDIWSLPIDANAARVRGEPERLTRGVAVVHGPRISVSGKKMVFGVRKASNWGLHLRDLVTGSETVLAQSTHMEWHPLSPDERKVAYWTEEKDGPATWISELEGGAPDKVCSDCGPPLDWSPDGTQILFAVGGGRPPFRALTLLDLASGRKRELLRAASPTFNNTARFSWDGQWLVFWTVYANQMLIAPVSNERVPEPETWIPVGKGDQPHWSPDGNTLYFLGERDCQMAQRLDPQTKRPVGDLLILGCFQIKRLLTEDSHISVAGDRIVYDLVERTSNIWMTELPRRR